MNKEPQLIIDDQPVIPNYPIQSTFKKSNYSMKIVVVGDGGCGKTCLLVSYTQQKFPEIYVPTVFENYVSNVVTPNNKLIELALWDTAGQEEYDRLRPLSYPDVDVILICFSLDNLISLQNVKDIWFPEVNHFCPGVPILLVGTKYDLIDENSFNPDLPIQLAYDINAIGYIQCSAKNMFNIKNVFNFAINHYHQATEQAMAANGRKRMSFLGHLRDKSKSSINSKHTTKSNGSYHGHHRKQSSIDSAIFNSPLTEENPPSNPYTSNYDTYDNDEFEFAKRADKKKSRRCTIL